MFPKRQIIGLACGCLVAAAISIAAICRALQPADPVVSGRPMSQWAFNLIAPDGPNKRSNSYHVPKEYQAAFAADPDAAIRWLQIAINYQPSKLHLLWRRFVAKLPDPFSRYLLPTLPLIANRWAGILALSGLARERPDPRIANFLLACMAHRDPRVRKVAAYEARPSLCPDDPKFAAAILARALDDPVAEVRRDACRRILESATRPDSYTVALLPLRMKVARLFAIDSANRPLLQKVDARLDSIAPNQSENESFRSSPAVP